MTRIFKEKVSSLLLLLLLSVSTQPTFAKRKLLLDDCPSTHGAGGIMLISFVFISFGCTISTTVDMSASTAELIGENDEKKEDANPEPEQQRREQKYFVMVNWENLKINMVRGDGEYLRNFWTLLRCDRNTYPGLRTSMQQNFEFFYFSLPEPEELLRRVSHWLNSYETASCSRLYWR